MLDKEAMSDIVLLKSSAKQIWGDNCKFGELEVLESPYPEFKLQMVLYNRVIVNIVYDRSMIGVGVKVSNTFINIDQLTKDTVMLIKESCSGERLIHDFRILDEVARKLMKTGKV